MATRDKLHAFVTSVKTAGEIESLSAPSPSSSASAVSSSSLARPPRSKHRIPQVELAPPYSSQQEGVPLVTSDPLTTNAHASLQGMASQRVDDHKIQLYSVETAPLASRGSNRVEDDPRASVSTVLSPHNFEEPVMDTEQTLSSTYGFEFDSDVFNNYIEEPFSSTTGQRLKNQSTPPSRDRLELLSEYPHGFDHLPPFMIESPSPIQAREMHTRDQSNRMSFPRDAQSSISAGSSGSNYSGGETDLARDSHDLEVRSDNSDDERRSGTDSGIDNWEGILGSSSTEDESSFKRDITDSIDASTAHMVFLAEKEDTVLPTVDDTVYSGAISPPFTPTTQPLSLSSRSSPQLDQPGPSVPLTSTASSARSPASQSPKDIDQISPSSPVHDRSPVLRWREEAAETLGLGLESHDKAGVDRPDAKSYDGVRNDYSWLSSEPEASGMSRGASSRSAETERRWARDGSRSSARTSPSLSASIELREVPDIPKRRASTESNVEVSTFSSVNAGRDIEERSIISPELLVSQLLSRREQPALSTKNLKSSQSSGALSPLGKTGASSWLQSDPPLSTPSPPLLSPISVGTIRRLSGNTLDDSEGTPKAALAVPLHGSRSSSRSSSRGALDAGSSIEGYYTSRSMESPATDGFAFSSDTHCEPVPNPRTSPTPLSSIPLLQAPTLQGQRQQRQQSVGFVDDSPPRTSSAARPKPKKPPPLRAKSLRRVGAALKKTPSSEELSSSADGGQYASADDSSMNGGFSDIEAIEDSGSKLATNLSASDLFDAYGHFDTSPSLSDVDLPAVRPRRDLVDLVIPNTRYDASSLHTPTANEFLSTQFMQLPPHSPAHSRSSSADMIDELDVQIEEAMANFAFHGITPASPTGPPPRLTVTGGVRTSSRRASGVDKLESERRPSLGMSSQSEDDVYHEATSMRAFSPDWSSSRSSPHTRHFYDEGSRRTSTSRRSIEEKDARDHSLRMLAAERIYDGGDDLSPMLVQEESELDDDSNRYDRQSGQRQVSTPEPSLPPFPLPPYPLSPSSNSRGDVKARAAAFVADLRRARGVAAAEAAVDSAAISSTATSTRNSVEAPIQTRRGSQGPPMSRAATSEPSVRSNSDQGRPTSPFVPITTNPEASVSNRSLASTLSVNGLMSSSATVTNRERPRMNSSTSLFSIAPTLPPSPSGTESNRLTRMRPLPLSARYAEIAKMKTAGERARSYAIKIHGLAAEDSGLSLWIGIVTGSPSSSTYRRGSASSNPASPPLQGHSRDDPLNVSTASSASFPLRKDAYRAKAIPQGGSYGAADLAPTVPYPGVMANGSGRFNTVRETKAPSNSKGFFSLGRKTSVSVRNTSAVVERKSGSSIGSMITGPLGLQIGIIGVPSPSSPGPISNAVPLNGGRALSGPRMPSFHDQRRSVDWIAAGQSAPFSPDASSLATMAAVLPQASRAELVECLRLSDEDVGAAIGLWVSSNK